MTTSDWINAAFLLLGMAFIFIAGLIAGRLWERGDYVRRVMVGAEPPPWDPDAELSSLMEYRNTDAWGHGEGRTVLVRRGIYDFDSERYV